MKTYEFKIMRMLKIRTELSEEQRLSIQEGTDEGEALMEAFIETAGRPRGPQHLDSSIYATRPWPVEKS